MSAVMIISKYTIYFAQVDQLISGYWIQISYLSTRDGK